jgi:hypothetical protein
MRLGPSEGAMRSWPSKATDSTVSAKSALMPSDIWMRWSSKGQSSGTPRGIASSAEPTIVHRGEQPQRARTRSPVFP